MLLFSLGKDSFWNESPVILLLFLICTANISITNTNSNADTGHPTMCFFLFYRLCSIELLMSFINLESGNSRMPAT
jgi:hypothetical protein